MFLLDMATKAVRKAFRDAVVGGVTEGIVELMKGVQPQGDTTLEHEEAKALLLAWQPQVTEEDAPAKRGRKATAS